MLRIPISGAICCPSRAGRHQEQAGSPGKEDHRRRREPAGEGGGAGAPPGGQRQGAGGDHQEGADAQVFFISPDRGYLT